LLRTLATGEPVGALLGTFGLDAGALLGGADALHGVLAPESADWRVRLATRGADDGDLEQLLAICRSADSHAYQLLEQLGVCSSKLRKLVIEQLRQRALSERPAVQASVRRPAATMARPRRPSSDPGRSHPPPTRTARTPGVRSGGDAVRPEVRVGASPGPADPSRAPTPAPKATTGGRLQPIDISELPPLHGRDHDLVRLADALGRRTVRAPLMVAPPGSGRTLLARHLARVLPMPVYRLDATAYEDEDSFAEDLRTISDAGGAAVLDDVDRVPSEVAPPFLGALAHAWTTAKPIVLTIVSPEGHGRLATWLPGATAAMDAISVDPLESADLEAAVKCAAERVLREHGMLLGPDAKLGELTRLAERYLTGLAMPARAIDLLDLACARTARSGAKTLVRATWLDIVSERSGLSAERIEIRGDQEILDLEHRLSRRVVGHAGVLTTLAALVRRNRAGFGGHRPMLTTLLLGPSGVGKTEIAKALSDALFDREDALVRLDMSEYAESHAVARILGAPPGYVGHEQGGALSDPLLGRPHCVILLDEIEKAHRDVHQLLLQVFDEGRLTDGRGRVVDFRHAAIIMTSNLGSNRFAHGLDVTMDESAVLAAARGAFPVELWNRIEAPLVMHPLSAQDMAKICRRLARASSDRLFRERGIRYAMTDAACGHMVALAGRDPCLGARPLRHLLVRDIESLIADAILRGQLRAGVQVEVGLQRGRITLA
jgi:ATP-dependent Clp protease ATP-binding subunit ClpC